MSQRIPAFILPLGAATLIVRTIPGTPFLMTMLSRSAFALLLLAALVAAAACGGEGGSLATSSEDTRTPTRTRTATPDATETGEPTETEGPAETETEGPAETETEDPTETPTEESTETATEEATETATEEATETRTEEPTETATSEPVETRTAPPTSTPTVDEQGGDPTFTPLGFALGQPETTDACERSNFLTEVPPDATAIHLTFEYSGMQDGQAWTREWFVDGEVWDTTDDTWRWGESGVLCISLFSPEGGPLRPGLYSAAISVDGTRLLFAAVEKPQ